MIDISGKIYLQKNDVWYIHQFSWSVFQMPLSMWLVIMKENRRT